MTFNLTTVKIPSATPGWNLDAWQYIPTGGECRRPGPHPVIILAHGLSANKLLTLDVYASRYAAEGYACVVFDYRRWGASDGTPRHVLRVSEQLEDYRTVINWARQRPELDKNRIILWGTSFSGGHILQLASEDQTIVAALVQCPYAGSAHSSGGTRHSLMILGLAPLYRPATSDPGKGGILSTPGAQQGMESLAKDPSHLQNKINASCIFQIRPYNPHFLASSITCPLLFIVPATDNICSISGALKAGADSKRSEVVRTEGGHFDVYPGRVGFDKALHAQIDFLRKHVPI